MSLMTGSSKTLSTIPIAKPWLDAEEEQAALEPLRAGWVVQGPKVRAFEEAVGRYSGSPFSIATSSCTAALHLGLLALGIGPGDEVIVPSFTFIATANVVEAVGARPVFIDSDLSTFNLDPAQLDQARSPKTKAIIPVHLFGLCADMAPVLDAAKSWGVPVLEDAACALGSQWRGRHAGTIGDIGALSFHARKIITTGEGGMILTSSDPLASLIRSLREHGADVDDFARHKGGQILLPEYPRPGLNYRMTDVQAAIGLAQVSTKLARITARRTQLAARYTERLKALSWLRPPVAPGDFVHSYQSYVCLYQPVEPAPENANALGSRRQTLMQRLREQGIETRQGTHAVHLLDYYAKTYGLKPSSLPNAWVADRATISLPIYAQMTDAEQDRVIDALASIGP